jgi:chromate reductase, NAD(P)H dehydrogenase (quinone)
MKHRNALRILAISGSLRRTSSNSALIEAAAILAPENVEVLVFQGLAEIPPFNPDLDMDPVPQSIGRFRAALLDCHAVVISSPEYAHGVSGVLKNALDWIVGSGELVGKPLALINTSARATHAWNSLVETLTVMSARVIPEASVTIPLQGRTLDAQGIAADAELSTLMRAAIDALALPAGRMLTEPESS